MIMKHTFLVKEWFGAFLSLLFPRCCVVCGRALAKGVFALMTGQQAGQVQISGDPTVLKRLLAYASKFEKTFNVIEP